MVELQIISKILREQSDDIAVRNNLTDEYFDEYKEEWAFIKSHKEEYNKIPDVETFLDKFPDFELLTVNESEEYLINTFNEEYVYRQSLPILNQLSDLMQSDSYAAVDYLKTHISDLQIPSQAVGTNIIAQAKERLEEYKNVSDDSDAYYIPTGFEELDDIIGGWHRGEELAVFFARTGMGKTWVVMKTLEHGWKMNNRIALLEPEMTANKVGYRFDTLHKHISNRALLRGEDVVGYERYINELSESEVPIVVLHPRKDFQRKVTVSKLRSYCEAQKMDMLVIDGISYMTDERKERGDNKTTQLTHISEDLMDLSIDLGIPVIIVVQANREGAREDDLQLENIRDSDGIAYNASIVISVQQKDSQLVLTPLKSRNSAFGSKLAYLWDIDTGMFTYIPSGDDDMYDDTEQAENLRNSYNDTSEEY
jgi:replicative DNA helicase